MKWMKNTLDLSAYNVYKSKEMDIFVSDEKVNWFRTSVKLGEALKKNDGCLIEDVYKNLKKQYIIPDKELILLLKRLSEKSTKKDIYDYKTKKVFLVLTKRCNLNCPMCYIDAKSKAQNYEMNLSELGNLFLQSKNLNFDSITLSGGEPLLRKDIKEIIKLAVKNFQNVSINTNATLLTKDMAYFLKDNNVNVMISLESNNPDMNDRIRGNGTYRKIMNAISYLKDAGHDSVSVSMTVTNQNFQQTRDMCSLCNKLNVEANYGPFIETGRGRCNKHDFSISNDKLTKAYFDSVKEKINSKGIKERGDSEFLKRCKVICGALYSIINVMPDGGIYPCSNLIEPEWNMGNILDNSLENIISEKRIKELIDKRDVRNIEGCKDCSIRFLCGGGCMANSYMKYDDIFTKDPLCEFYKAIYTNYINSWQSGKSSKENTLNAVQSYEKGWIYEEE